jgi:hypothetical protein
MALSLRHGLSAPPFTKIAPLLAMAILGEEVVVLQRQRSGSPALSFSAPAHVAAAILLGPLPAAGIAALGVIVVDGLRTTGRKFLLLNASMFSLSTWAAATVFQVAGGSHGNLAAPSLPALVAVLALVATRYAVTSLILWGGHVLVTGRSAAFVLGETLWGELGSAIGEGALGVLVAIAFLPGHWLVLMLVLPLTVALYRSKAIFEQLKQETQEALDAVATVIDERHPTTAEHTERVAGLVRRFVEAIGLPDGTSDRLVLAARFHDIGNIAVDASTLSKAERLTEEELASIRGHPRLSARLLSPFHFAREIARYVEYHHERYDGRGYYSIRNEDIPVESHVLVVADSFDAMTSPRPYRPALTVEEAAAELYDKSGTQFHPLIARAFGAIVSGDPVESALTGGELQLLRAAFRQRHGLTLLSDLRLPDRRLATIALAGVALALAGISSLPPLVPAAVAAAAFAAGISWLVKSVSLARRRRVALTALAAGASVEVTLATSGIARWFAWLELDPVTTSYRLTGGGGKMAADEVAEACGWANRRTELISSDLSGGRRLVLAAASGGSRRLALALDRRSSPAVEELCEQICASAAADAPPPSLRLVGGTDAENLPLVAVLVVELRAFESVRTAAGQLVAGRIVAEAERRLRSMLRESDRIEQLGDDRFSIALRVKDAEHLAAIERRVVDELATIGVPRRTPALAPLVEVTGFESAPEGSTVGSPAARLHESAGPARGYSGATA